MMEYGGMETGMNCTASVPFELAIPNRKS